MSKGLIEIKSAIPHIHYERIRRNSYDPTYKWQLAFNLKESDRDWIDFISYCSNFPENKRLFVHRLMREELKKEFRMIDERLEQFFDLIEAIKKNIRGY